MTRAAILLDAMKPRCVAALLAALALVGCATRSPSVWTNGGGVAGRVPATTQRAAESLRSAPLSVTAAPAAITLTWTMPRLKSNGDTLGTAPLDWQVAYSHRSQTYIDHEFWIRTNPDSATRYWPAVRAEAAPLVVWSGTARPGEHVEWVALPVTAGAWPYSWWIRTRQRPAGEWSLYSNPVTRADNN